MPAEVFIFLFILAAFVGTPIVVFSLQRTLLKPKATPERTEQERYELEVKKFYAALDRQREAHRAEHDQWMNVYQQLLPARIEEPQPWMDHESIEDIARKRALEKWKAQRKGPKFSTLYQRELDALEEEIYGEEEEEYEDG